MGSPTGYLFHARAFEHPRTGPHRGIGHPEHETQGMQVSAALVHPAADVAIARDFLAHLRSGQHSVSGIAEAPMTELRLALDPPHVALARGCEQVARPPVAVDAVAGDAVHDDRLRLLAQRPELGGVRRTDGSFQHAHRLAHAAADLAAVASARAPSHAFRLEHDDRVATLGQMQGGGDPGESGPDDADVRRLAPRQRTMGLTCRRSGRVVGVGKFHGPAFNLVGRWLNRGSVNGAPP